MKHIVVYCDGSSLGNPGAGGWCGILHFKDSTKIVSGGVPNTTNNRMELLAVVMALKALKEPCEVTLYTDSKYVCDGIKLWLDKWVAKRFYKVKNPDLWREYLIVSAPHKVYPEWVKSHSGNEQNEKCDRIAREEASRVKGITISTLFRGDL